MNPIVSLKLYLSVVIPKGLFGSELWNGLKTKDIIKLENFAVVGLKIGMELLSVSGKV